MKATFIINTNSGKDKLIKHITKILKELYPIFGPIEVYPTSSIEEAKKIALELKDKIDVLLVAGGDGTFHQIINVYAPLKNPPALAFFNSGTSSDTLLNLGLGKSYKKTLKALKENSVYKIDLFKVNSEYCIFMGAGGIFSDIAYTTSKKSKNLFGKFAYYFKAVKELFKKEIISGSYTLNNNNIIFNFKTSFLLLLNGKYIANFKINKKSKLNDGRIELMYSNQKIFHGLLNYLLNQKTLNRVSISNTTIDIGNNRWCIDGEIGPVGKVKVKVLKKHLKIYSFIK